jgi:hypothetical protein
MMRRPQCRRDTAAASGKTKRRTGGLQLAPDDHVAFGVNTMDLKNRLCDVYTDCCHSLHGPVLRIRSPYGDHGTYVPVEEPSTASIPDPCTAALHSITSSAVASSLSGMVRPSAFAVLRLTTNSNLVACCTGISAGFSPFSMRPTYIPIRRLRSASLVP